MGAADFYTYGRGATPKEAFKNAREEALWESGHGGYSGTIAEKRAFVMIDLPHNSEAMAYAELLIEQADSRIDDKWGPAGCIKVKDGVYLFFGWASE